MFESLFEFLFKYRPLMFEQGDFTFRASWAGGLALLAVVAAAAATPATAACGAAGVSSHFACGTGVLFDAADSCIVVGRTTAELSRCADR